jgi:uncharacterized protein (AIM24 family)
MTETSMIDPESIPQQGECPSGARYHIQGETLPSLVLHVPKGTTIIADPAAFQYRTDTFDVSANPFKQGLGNMAKRMLSGESAIWQEFTATQDGDVAFHTSIPGVIVPVMLQPGQEIFCQPGAFMAAEEGVQVSARVPGLLAGMFGGEDILMQKITGPGMVFLDMGGTVSKRTLEPGEKLIVNTGNVAMFSEGVEYKTEWVKGWNILQQGLFNTTLTGPGEVYLQSMSPQQLATSIARHLPTPQNVGVDAASSLFER